MNQKQRKAKRKLRALRRRRQLAAWGYGNHARFVEPLPMPAISFGGLFDRDPLPVLLLTPRQEAELRKAGVSVVGAEVAVTRAAGGPAKT